MQRFSHSRWLIWPAGLLSLAVAMAGIGLAGAPGDEPKQDEKKAEPKKEPAPKETKKDKIKKNVPGAPEFEEVFKNLPQGVDPEQLRQMQAEMQRMMQQLRQQFPGGLQGNFPGAGGLQGGQLGFAHPREGRLGVRVSAPNTTLTEQLDLPKGQGLVVEDVQGDSAAAKAGIKNNDILLEVNGKNVPANPVDFVRMLKDVKADTPVDAVVLRKGKREAIKGLSLPEAKADDEEPAPFKGFRGGNPLGGAAGGLGGPGGLPGGPRAGFPAGGLGGAGGGGLVAPGGLAGGAGGFHVMTSVFRTDDRFTTRHQEGTLVITVTGAMADGKAKVSGINVQDARESHKYESVDKVAEQYRDKVKNLIEMSEKSGGKVEIKTPKIEKQ